MTRPARDPRGRFCKAPPPPPIDQALVCRLGEYRLVERPLIGDDRYELTVRITRTPVRET